MVSVTEAKQILSQSVIPLRGVSVAPADSINCVLAENVTAGIDVPVFDNSAMDGYALMYAPSLSGYHICGQSQAGDTQHTVSSGDAVRIFTGAPVPHGANTVVPQELCVVENDILSFDSAGVSAGQHIRRKASQCHAGNEIVFKGTVITPGTVSLLVSAGVQTIKVHNKPSVAIIVTGNELQEPGTPLQEGKIYNSNTPALISYLKLLGIWDIESCYVRDDLNDLSAAIEKLLISYDVLIITGGISVGDYDYTGKALLQEGVHTLFYKIKQKPGKPMFAGLKGNKMIFALPGNPAAVLTCFNQYVKPSLLAMMGYKNAFAPSCTLPLTDRYSKSSALTFFLKARMYDGKVEILNGQESYNLSAYCQANCFVEIEEGQMELEKNTMVNVYTW